MLNFICIIPARGGSKGIPKKNIMKVGGSPLITWSVARALKSKHIGRHVYVTSDSDEILEVAKNSGAQCIKRPLEISGDTATSESALVHAYNEIKKTSPSKIDFVVFLQATSPLRRLDDIDRAIDVLIENNADSLLSTHPLKDYFIWQKSKDGFIPKNHDYKNRKRRQDLETTYLENGSIYIFRPENLILNNNRLGGKIVVHEMDKIHSFQIDDPEEVQICDYFLRKFYPEGP